MSIKHLRFTDAGPFDDIRFDFDKRVNVITGPNNSGKSTVLLVLGELLVYPFGVPSKYLRSEAARWELSYRTGQGDRTKFGLLPTLPPDMVDMYEQLGYTCFVPAQRHSSDYRSRGPTVNDRNEDRIRMHADHLTSARPEVLDEADIVAIRQSIRESRAALHPELARREKLMMSGTSLVSDEAVVQKIVDLDYASHRLRKPNIRETIELIAVVATEITDGFPMKFEDVGDDERGLYPIINTQSGNLPLDTLSQGTQSILHCVARILLGYAEFYDFPNDLAKQPGIVIVDEIDAHLHPSWQRRFIPTLTKHFPNLQIFCSTHSPLMLAGLGPGQVQLLTRDDDDVVKVSRNGDSIAGWSADQILRNLLGVRNPTDLKTVATFDRLEELRTKEGLSEEESAELERLTLLSDAQPTGGSASILMEKLARGIMEIAQEAASPEP
jgi:energy-coupling factor transporter ATP-binding protein EcfA2